MVTLQIQMPFQTQQHVGLAVSAQGTRVRAAVLGVPSFLAPVAADATPPPRGAPV